MKRYFTALALCFFALMGVDFAYGENRVLGFVLGEPAGIEATRKGGEHAFYMTNTNSAPSCSHRKRRERRRSR